MIYYVSFILLSASMFLKRAAQRGESINVARTKQGTSQHDSSVEPVCDLPL